MNGLLIMKTEAQDVFLYVKISDCQAQRRFGGILSIFKGLHGLGSMENA